jgi:hypothetical protein
MPWWQGDPPNMERAESIQPNNGGDIFLRNVGSYESHTASHPRKMHSSGLNRFKSRETRINHHIVYREFKGVAYNWAKLLFSWNALQSSTGLIPTQFLTLSPLPFTGSLTHVSSQVTFSSPSAAEASEIIGLQPLPVPCHPRTSRTAAFSI